MRYLALVFSNEVQPSLTELEPRRLGDAYNRFTLDARAAGVLLDGGRVQSPDMATVVRARDRGTEVEDAPCADTDGPVCGFYMLECENLDQAIEWAARIPHASIGAVEIRPILDR